MVWHDCLLTTNDEHLFTGEAWVLCRGKRSEGWQLPGQGFAGGSGMLPFGQSEKAVDCRKATD